MAAKEIQPVKRGDHFVAKTFMGEETRVQVKEVEPDGSVRVSDGYNLWSIPADSLAAQGFKAESEATR